MRYVVPVFAALLIVGIAPAPATGQCNECITQTLGGITEHWFGNRPDDEEWEGDHTNPEGGSCSNYHQQENCLFEQQDVQDALAAMAAGTFDFDGLRALKLSLGEKLWADASTGLVYAFSCNYALLGEFDVPAEWVTRIQDVGQAALRPVS